MRQRGVADRWQVEAVPKTTRETTSKALPDRALPNRPPNETLPKPGPGRSEPDEVADDNHVRLRGRVSSEPEERTLPSGDRLRTFRLVVPRPPGRARQRVDVVECAVWTAALRRRAGAWQVGDEVEVEGSLRKRFYRAPGGATGSRVEVEVVTGRRVRRAGSA